MSNKKSKTTTLRLSEYEDKLVKYISDSTNLPSAEIFRIGLSIIARGCSPKEIPKLKSFYETEVEDA